MNRACVHIPNFYLTLMRFTLHTLLTTLLLLSWRITYAQSPPPSPIRAVNEVAIPSGEKTVAIVGATLIDGRGGDPVPDACIIVRGNTIVDVGTVSTTTVPPDAEVVEAPGMSVLPGLIDAHFHLNNDSLPALFLQHGITSLRDPGAWIASYEQARAITAPLPRLFLTGPHLDGFPPAYPQNSYIVQDTEEARRIVNRLADQGASAIKVYFRLSLAQIQQVCTTAHERGLPVTAHLEITDARDAIQAGLDGIEHITSLGTALLPLREAETYRQSMLTDNSFRRLGRYQVWSTLDTTQQSASVLAAFLAERETFVCPTLGAFEYRKDTEEPDTVKEQGFRQMMEFTNFLHRNGVQIVVGSHGGVRYAASGWAYQHEMELMVESGISPAAVITDATLENARFFRVEDRLGSVEVGKQADLLLLDGNPLEDIRAMRQIQRVMLNGRWVTQ